MLKTLIAFKGTKKELDSFLETERQKELAKTQIENDPMDILERELPMLA